MWLEKLRAECARRGQSAVARLLDLSPATVSLVLSGKYRADTKAIQQRVEERIRNGLIACPELGVIEDGVCMKNKHMPFSTANRHRVQMWQACRACGRK